MTKTEFVQQFNIDAAPTEVKEELASILADMPDELSQPQMKEIADYVVMAEAREAELALGYTDAAKLLERYANDIDRDLEQEDQDINDAMRDDLKIAQQMAA